MRPDRPAGPLLAVKYTAPPARAGAVERSRLESVLRTAESRLTVVVTPAGWGKTQAEEWEAKHYHQVSDELRPDWDFSGMVEDTQLDFYLGVKVANQTALPAWKPGDEFEAARKKALEEIAQPSTSAN